MNATDLSNLEAERKALGVYLLDAETLLDSPLKFTDFSGKHRTICDAMQTLVAEGEPVNPVTVVAKAKKIGGATAKNLEVADLEGLQDGVDPFEVAQISGFERLVQEAAEKQALFKDLRKAAESVLNSSSTVDEVRENVLQAMLKRSDNRDKAYLEGGAAAADAGLDYLEQIMAAKGGLLGLGTGISGLDDLTGGFQGGQVIVLAAATGAGKTTAALQIVRNTLSQNKPVYYASLEMSQTQCVVKMACAAARVNDQKFRTHPNAPDHAKLAKALEILHSRPFYCDDRAGASLSQIRTGAMQAHRKSGGLSLIVVDYLQLMSGEGRGNEPRAVEVGRFANGLKALARDLDVPVIALAQINREGQKRTDKRPMLTDLRESADIENAADIVAFLYREGYYDPDTTDPQATELIVRKNRFGPQGTVYLEANLAFSSFVETAAHA